MNASTDAEATNRKRKVDELVDAEEERSEEKKVAVEPSTSSPATGFAAYAKSNPFLAAAAAAPRTGFGFGFAATQSAPTVGCFGFGASLSAPLSLSAPVPVPAVQPSPKSPKPNPFSSPSPAHNPFMTIENKDELWQRMAADKLSDEEAAKLTLVLPAQKKARVAGFSSAETERETEREDKDKSTADTNSSNTDTINTAAAAVSSTNAADDDNEEEKAEDDKDEGEGEDAEGERSPGKLYTTYALPENAVVVTGEELDDCLLQTRAKLYRLGVKTQSASKSDDEGEEKEKEKKVDASAAEWVEMGVGPVKVLRRKADAQQDEQEKKDEEKEKDSKDKVRPARLVVRREDKKGGIGTKLLMNVRLNQYVSIVKHGDKMIRLICVNAADPMLQLAPQKAIQLQTYLLRTKTAQDAIELLDLLKSCAAAAEASQSTTESTEAATESSQPSERSPQPEEQKRED